MKCPLPSLLTAVAICLAAIAGPVFAQGGGLLGALSDEPEPEPGDSSPDQPTAPEAPPSGTPSPAAVGTPPSFPTLANCRGKLSGLPVGTKEETIALLKNRIAFWRAQELPTIVTFRHPRQAEQVLDCFETRLALLSSYVAPTAARKEAERVAAEIRQRWGERFSSYLSADAEESGSDAWWQEADAVMELLARLDVRLEKAKAETPRERGRLLEEASLAVNELRKTIETVKSAQETFDVNDRAFWLRALAWRARQAGLALDELQLYDFEQDPDGTYAHLTATGDAAGSGAAVLEGDLIAAIERLRQVWRASREFDAGAPRDWSQMGQRQAVLEGLYLLNYAAETIEDRIDRWQREQAEVFRWKLRDDHDAALRQGIPAEESKAARDREWREFREQQRREKAAALRRWEALIKSERHAARLEGPRLAGVSR